MLALPPYGKILLAYQEQNIPYEFYISIFVGQDAKQIAYKQKCIGALCSYLPMGEHFTKFNWPIVNQRIIVDADGSVPKSHLQLFCRYLLTFHPRVIFLNHPQFCDLFKL